MRSDQARGLMQGSLGRGHDESHGEHGVREILCGERDDEITELTVGVLLSVGVGQSQSQGAQEEDAIHAEATGDLRENSNVSADSGTSEQMTRALKNMMNDER